MILSVGYRVNSKKATNFRKWATKTLKQHIVQGYTINKKQISYNYQNFLKAVDSIKKLSKDSDLVGSNEALDLIKVFANTWISLESYDKSDLPQSGTGKRKVKFTADELHLEIEFLKSTLIKKGEASPLFAQEKKKDSFTGVVGNIFQTFEGKDLYPSLEQKAAHLLYFVTKNHVFNDGNKRSAAFSFVWFLQKAKMLDTNSMSPVALTTLTLLIAESNPKDKDRMIGLVLLLLRR